MTLNRSEAWWTETLRVGGIDPSYRPQLELRLGQRLAREGDVDLEALDSARKDVRRLIAAGRKALGIVSRLENNREYLRHNAAPRLDRLEELGPCGKHRALFISALEEFQMEKTRLAGRSPKGADIQALARLITDLLEIWAKSHGVDVLDQASRLDKSGKFIKFLARCARATESHLSDAALRETFKRARKLAANELCKRRTQRARQRDHGQRRSAPDGFIARRPRTAARHHAQHRARRREP